ncbi:Hypothetical predicted protein [Cloeon dipterum]|uniref:Uncharacterized protein n=1 Tax=Cloeon dipterum TaxID=197152 RepID=A0A8S1DA83_9INSE|nr:Hypothetical predicted protein [Cloeon dipterum]
MIHIYIYAHRLVENNQHCMLANAVARKVIKFAPALYNIKGSVVLTTGNNRTMDTVRISLLFALLFAVAAVNASSTGQGGSSRLSTGQGYNTQNQGYGTGHSTGQSGQHSSGHLGQSTGHQTGQSSGHQSGHGTGHSSGTGGGYGHQQQGTSSHLG